MTLDATLDTLTPITTGVNSRPGAVRDTAERPSGAAFGEIFTAQDTARGPSSAAGTPGQPMDADGKNLPPVAGTAADIAADVAAQQPVPIDTVQALSDTTAEDALAAAELADNSVVVPVAPPVVSPLTAAEQAGELSSERALAATASALDTRPLQLQSTQPQATPSGDAPLSTPGNNAVASLAPRAAVAAATTDINGPAGAMPASGAQVELAADALLPDDQSRLMQPLAGAVRAAFGSPDGVALRPTAEMPAVPLASRGAAPSAALFGPTDQAVLAVDTQLAQGDAARLPTDLLEEFAAEQLLNRAPAQSASAPLAQPGSFAALIPLADADVALGAKAGVLPPLLAAPGDPAFDTELAGRVSLLVRDGLSEARLQLNPPELGRLDIKISTDGDQTRVSFLVQGAETRDAIEQAMPRLRELLEQSGLQLSRFDVADHSRSQHQGEGRAASGAYSSDSSPAGEGEPADTTATLRVAQGSQSLVDFYV